MLVRRVIRHIDSRIAQTWLLTFWSKGKEQSDEEVLVNQTFRPTVPSLFLVTERAIKDAPPIEVGRFLAIINDCSNYLGLFLMQSPTHAQLAEYCAKLLEYIRLHCPNFDAENLKMDEIAHNIEVGLNRRRIVDPNIEAIEAALLPINTTEARWRGITFNSRITQTIFVILTAGLRTTFRNKYNLWQFLQVSRGFRQEQTRPGNMPDPEILNIQTNTTGHHDHDEDLRPSGERIPLGNFCEPANTVPAGLTCSICVGELEDATIESDSTTDEVVLRVTKPDGRPIDEATLKLIKTDEQPVVTACGHCFHKTCLDTWINDSGMRTANLCPSCRTKMCEGRPRVPASLEEMVNADIEVSAEEDEYIMAMELEEGINDELSGRAHDTM